MSDFRKLTYVVEPGGAPLQWAARSKFDFDQTLERLRAAIAELDLWLIHEIDPQMLLRRAGLEILSTRQLLFFHPRYMERLLSADARALPEAPLKIVVMARPDGEVVLRGPEIGAVLDRYDGLHDLGQELSGLVQSIVKGVAA